MNLLPSEFVNYARYARISSERIREIIGSELMEFELAEEEVVRSDLPSNDEITIANWELLEDPSQVMNFKKIARRSVFEESKLFCSTDDKRITAVGTTPLNSILFNAYPKRDAFIKEITGMFEAYECIEQELRHLQGLSADEFFVLVGLLELFIEKYPSPDTEWLPDELLIFSVESLREIIADSEDRIEDQTWWQHWKKLTNARVPEAEAMETALLMLSNRELTGVFGEIEGKELYYIGQSLLWIIRGLVWWDRGFVVENESNDTQLFVFEGSALFALIVENENNYSLYNIDGRQLPKLVSNFFELGSEVIHSEEKTKAEATETKLNFCTNCGSPITEGANFCGNCGQNLR